MALDGAISSKEFDGSVSKRFMAYIIILVAIAVFILSGIWWEFQADKRWRESHQKESDQTHEAIIKEFQLKLEANSNKQSQDLATQVELLNQALERLEHQQNYDRERVSRVCQNETELLNHRVTQLEK